VGIRKGTMTGIFLDITGRKQAEEGHELMAGEMSHRVKNLLAIASGLTRLTSRSATSAEDMAKQLINRLTALDRAHDLVRPLPGGHGKTALLGDIFTVLLAPYDDDGAFAGRIRVAVPRMGVGADTATTLALIVHELATNAVKYGALSVKDGTLDITGSMEDENVRIVWTEQGGPEVAVPVELSGYGSGLIRRALEDQLRGSVSYAWLKSGALVTMILSGDRMAS
jgi:two-component sensor histidine kinase